MDRDTIDSRIIMILEKLGIISPEQKYQENQEAS